MPSMMELYDFDTAPEELQKLSQHGGDEDGILVVPPGMDPPYWIEKLWSYDMVEPIVLSDGRKVYIWAHA